MSLPMLAEDFSEGVTEPAVLLGELQNRGHVRGRLALEGTS